MPPLCPPPNPTPVLYTRSKTLTNSQSPLIQNSLCPVNIAIVSSLIIHKQSKHETWDDLWHIVNERPPTGSLFNQRPVLLVVLGCRAEMCSTIVLMSRIQISTFFFSKGPNSQREHMQSHETCPRKTTTPVTCGDCQCGPLNPQGRSNGPSMGWFNYTRKTLWEHVCICVYV